MTHCGGHGGSGRGTTPAAPPPSPGCSRRGHGPIPPVRGPPLPARAVGVGVMAHYAVSAVGADRPGIVAAVTGAFLEHGCNLEDTSMTILRGHFAMMLVVAAPDGLERTALESALAGPASAFELVVAVRAIDDDVPSS